MLGLKFNHVSKLAQERDIDGLKQNKPDSNG